MANRAGASALSKDASRSRRVGKACAWPTATLPYVPRPLGTTGVSSAADPLRPWTGFRSRISDVGWSRSRDGHSAKSREAVTLLQLPQAQRVAALKMAGQDGAGSVKQRAQLRIPPVGPQEALARTAGRWTARARRRRRVAAFRVASLGVLGRTRWRLCRGRPHWSVWPTRRRDRHDHSKSCN